MVNRSKDKGTWAESAVTQVMKDTWWPNAHRHSGHGSKDIGDINTGNPKLVVEVKADKALTYPQFLRETEAERINAEADLGVCVIKPPGVAQRRMNLWWMLMSEQTWYQLHDAPMLTGRGYEGPTILWLEGRTDLGRAFNPGRWLAEAAKVAATHGDHVHPGARRISQAVGSMRFVYLPTGLAILAACGYGDK